MASPELIAKIETAVSGRSGGAWEDLVLAAAQLGAAAALFSRACAAYLAECTYPKKEGVDGDKGTAQEL